MVISSLDVLSANNKHMPLSESSIPRGTPQNSGGVGGVAVFSRKLAISLKWGKILEDRTKFTIDH